VRFEVARIDDGDGALLVAALLADLVDRYGVEDPDEPAPADLAPPGGVFLVAYVDDVAVGCGGVRRHARGIGELKRMYVTPAARRTGVARQLLDRLEQHAVALGYSRLRLETGVRQPEAIALYESSGYNPIEPYGHYRNAPLSRCFEKRLASRDRDQGTSW
jgi:GNAT superfamily N-acetyltransferase